MKNSHVLESLRPDPVLDPVWSDVTLERILASRGRRPAGGEVRRGGRLRSALVALAVVVPTVAGVGVVAAAEGLMPRAFTEAFSHWRKASPATAERVATAPGPDGTVFTVMSARGEDGHLCRTSLLESEESAAGPGPASFTDITSNFCTRGPSVGTFGSIDVSYVDGVAGFVVSAGDAVRAEVRTEEGRELPALLVEGDFWGWFPESVRPTLVGYAADGSVVGRVRLW